jgi:hypothetical protein
MSLALLDAGTAVLEERIGAYSTEVLLPAGDLILVVEMLGGFIYSRSVIRVQRSYLVPGVPDVHGQEFRVSPGGTLVRGELVYDSTLTFRALQFTGRVSFNYSVFFAREIMIVNPSALASGVESVPPSVFVPTLVTEVVAFASDPLRVGGLLFNDGSQSFNIGFNSSSGISGAIVLKPGGVIDVPPGFTGPINATPNTGTSQLPTQRLRLLAYKGT